MAAAHLPDLWLLRCIHQRWVSASLGRALPAMWQPRAPPTDAGLGNPWGAVKLLGKRILHFAPEKAVMWQMRNNPLYETADLHQPGVTHRTDIRCRCLMPITMW